MVLPVPGGPCNKIPRGGEIPKSENKVGLFNGSSIVDFNNSICFDNPPT